MNSWKRTAFVFCGQGSHRKGMGLPWIGPAGSTTAKVWNAASDRLQRSYAVNLGTIIRDDPVALDVSATMAEDALNGDTLIAGPPLTRQEAAIPLQRIRGNPNVMQLTWAAQPAMLTAQMIMWESFKEQQKQQAVCQRAAVFAGHSLGEFSALTAAGVFPVDVAVDLVFRRGVLMQRAVDAHQSRSSKHPFMMYACSPKRALLDRLATGSPSHAPPAESPPSTTSSSSTDADKAASDLFEIIVELLGQSLRQTTSFVELVNVNTAGDQFVVAGDAFALAALGKLLDPQFRANDANAVAASDLNGLVRAALLSVKGDHSEGVTANPNAPSFDFVPGSAKKWGRNATFKRLMRGPDDGHTLSLDELSNLTLEDDGRSGLKKKSWFIPLPVSTPFHSSLLRRAMDQFYPLLREALPTDETLSRVLWVDGINSRKDTNDQPVWVTNLTGTVFGVDDHFRTTCDEFLTSMNVGEVLHHGKYQSMETLQTMRRVLQTSPSPRELMAVALAGQLAHAVQWVNCMETTVDSLQVDTVVEIAPDKTLSEMFRKSTFVSKRGADLTVSTFGK